jgi:guanylate kinase
LDHARKELEAVPEFDYVIVNDELERAYGRIEAILQAEWARVDRIRDLDDHARRLRSDLDQILRTL